MFDKRFGLMQYLVAGLMAGAIPQNSKSWKSEKKWRISGGEDLSLRICIPPLTAKTVHCGAHCSSWLSSCTNLVLVLREVHVGEALHPTIDCRQVQKSSSIDAEL